MDADDRYHERLAGVLAKDPRYRPEAYDLVRTSVTHTAGQLRARGGRRRKHIRGPELLEGLRELALREYGPLAIDVLEAWGLRSTEDVGHVVFNLVEAELLSASPEDSLRDFVGVYDFSEAFVKPFVPVGEVPRHPARIA